MKIKAMAVIKITISCLIFFNSINTCFAADFPSTYEKSSEKVKFDCELEIPKDFSETEMYSEKTKGRIYPDMDKTISIYTQGKEVKENGTIPAASSEDPEGVYYVFTDGSTLSVDSSFTYGSDTAKYYGYIGVRDPQYKERFEQQTVSFMDKNTVIEKVSSDLENIGIDTTDISWDAYPLNHEAMSQLENEQISDGLDMEEHRKESWTEEDDAYFVYGVQMSQKLPVFHELMNTSRQLAYDTPDSSVIQAIYSKRGVDILSYSGYMYKFDVSDQKINFLAFDDIASVVFDKFNNLLNESTYKITRAKLYERVFLNEAQQMEVSPVWYFEILQDDDTTSITLVDAVSGEEIYLE